MVVSVDHEIHVSKGKKAKDNTDRKRKNKDRNLVERQSPEDEVNLEEKHGELMIMVLLLHYEQDILMSITKSI